MRVLTIEETEAWLAERRLGLQRASEWGLDHALVFRPNDSVTEFTVPAPQREQLVLAHQLGRWFNCSAALLVMTVVTGFMDAELDLFLELRRYYGDPRWVDDVPGGATPGQIFDDSDRENRRTVTEYLYLLMAFNFEGYFVETDGHSIIWCGDDIIEIHTRDQGKTDELQRGLKRLGIPLLGLSP